MNVVVIESNPADAYLTVEALKNAGFAHEITVIENGERALTYLGQFGEKSATPIPDLVLLDLNLVPISGLEVLTAIRSDPKLECVPVLVVSGSQNAEDVRKAYQLGANCFITKPNNLDQFMRFMKSCHEFWGMVATLPPPPVTLPPLAD
jgi:two-component system, chemotaxis family, response regulator Rcp1